MQLILPTQVVRYEIIEVIVITYVTYIQRVLLLVFSNGIVIEWVSGSFTSRPVNPTYPLTLTILFSSISIIEGFAVGEHDGTNYLPITVNSGGVLTPKNSGEYMIMVLGI